MSYDPFYSVTYKDSANLDAFNRLRVSYSAALTWREVH